MSFSNLNLITPLLEVLNELKYSKPTPVQEQSIPIVLAGRDIFGCAQTGTGKTAAFALPILQHISLKKHKPGNHIKALVLAPTRELALQIGQSFSEYGRKLPYRNVVLFGGVSQVNQTNALKNGVDILIATPGRLLDLMNQGFIDLKHIEYFVLDEADRMLDMGFINDIKKIIVKLPQQKQTLFFSATAAPEIMKLANTLLKNPAKVNVTPISTPAEQVKQLVYHVKKENKRSLLRHVLESNKINHALVFTRTKRGADRVVKDLNKNGIKAEAIHGDKSQGARERALNGFKKRSIQILVATDIASRGIDVDRLTHVINFEIPEQAETYVHRIGRTGRAGESGIALSFCTDDEKPYLNDINKLIKQNIDVVKTHPYK